MRGPLGNPRSFKSSCENIPTGGDGIWVENKSQGRTHMIRNTLESTHDVPDTREP